MDHDVIMLGCDKIVVLPIYNNVHDPDNLVDDLVSIELVYIILDKTIFVKKEH